MRPIDRRRNGSPMSFDEFVSAIKKWFEDRYINGTVELIIQPLANGEAQISITTPGNENSAPGDPAPFRMAYSGSDALMNTRIAIENKMLSRDERRRELMEADINDPQSAGLIDDFYTDAAITEGDRSCLERFLRSSNLETRREALIALMFGVNQDAGPKFTGYAVHGLLLNFLGAIEDKDSQFTGASVLFELRARGDENAIAILKLLESNRKWREVFG
jgi:hypothetical protein